MPRLHYVKKARKDHPEIGIKKGEPYYWAAFKTGPRTSIKKKWKDRPRPSQLTLSEYLSQAYSIQESVEDAVADHNTEDCDLDGVADRFEEAADEIRELGEEQEEKKECMPEGLQEGPTGELLQQRADECQGLADELSQAADELRSFDLEASTGITEEEYTKEDFDRMTEVQDAVQEALDDALQSINWEFS